MAGDGTEPGRTGRATLRTRLAAYFDVNHGTHRGWVRTMLAQAEYLLGWLDPYVRPEPRHVQRLVFVCLGNINRSAFAAAVARRRGAQVVSMGLATETGVPATSAAQRCATTFGIDLADHTATDISDYAFEPGDLLLVMETRHARRLVEIGYPTQSIALLGRWSSPQRIHLHDPHKLSDAYFRSCFTLLHAAVDNLLDDLAAAGSPGVSGLATPRPRESVPVAPGSR